MLVRSVHWKSLSAPNRSKVTTLCFHGAQRWERDGESISSFNVTPMGIAFRYNYPLFRRQLYLARGPFHSFHPEETPLALLARFLGRVRTFLSLFSFRFSPGRPSCVHYTHSYAFSRTDNGAPNFFPPSWPPFLTASFDSDDPVHFREKFDISFDVESSDFDLFISSLLILKN